MAASDSLNQHLFDPGPRQATPSAAEVSSGHGFGQRSLFSPAPYARQANPANVTPAEEPGGFLDKHYQLPMFMTPREIHEKYEPLTGDRLDSWTEGGGTGFGSGNYDDPRAGEATNRSQRTDWVDNVTNHYQVRSSDSKYRRPKNPMDSGGDYRPENDEELWSRKYEEAEDRPASGHDATSRYLNVEGKSTSAYYDMIHHSAGEQHTNYSSGGQWHTGSSAPLAKSSFYKTHYNQQIENPEADMTLAESIAEGGVKSPIRLGETTGIHGKPEIVGGHHRLAVASVHAPDQFMPVLHYNSIRDAKSDPVYKYS